MDKFSFGAMDDDAVDRWIDEAMNGSQVFGMSTLADAALNVMVDRTKQVIN